MPATSRPVLPRPSSAEPSSSAPRVAKRLAHALARMLAQRVGHLVAHDHRHLVVAELQLRQDAPEEGDLAAGHAEGVDLRAAEQDDFPLPLLGARVPWRRERDDALGDEAQPHQLRVVVGRQRACLRAPGFCICTNCCAAACSTCSAGTSLAKRELLPTSTPSSAWASTAPGAPRPSRPSDSRRRPCRRQPQPARAADRAARAWVTKFGSMAACDWPTACQFPAHRCLIVAGAGGGRVHLERAHAVAQPPQHPQAPAARPRC